jgi:putative component of toxin-antitoxin plasmid stabilization module
MLQILRTAEFDALLGALRDKVGQKQVLARLARLSLSHWEKR